MIACVVRRSRKQFFFHSLVVSDIAPFAKGDDVVAPDSDLSDGETDAASEETGARWADTD